MTRGKPSLNETPSEKWNANSGESELSKPHTIQSINHLDPEIKRAIYARLIPCELLDRFHLAPDLKDEAGCDLLSLYDPPGDPFAEMSLYHAAGFHDPILTGQIIDTSNGLLHILLYVLNDPESPRFDVDCLPDGATTGFGTQCRNLEAELASMQFGLSPGQVRRGLRMMGPALRAFEGFVSSLGHDMYFAEPLFYHNAVIFEKYGFSYAKGLAIMERIQSGFAADGSLTARLDGSSPFRQPGAANSIRLRSWAIHDNLAGTPFMGVMMYKRVGISANVNTCPDCTW